ncbi:MAG TPA: hypothetical protein VF588_08430 [Pyrinomonadaceae bacterium]|jgi:hypothetical protein
MRFCTAGKAATLLALVALACAANDAAPYAQRPTLPNPVLFLQRVEPVTTGGKEFARYYFGVENAAAYPDTMFAAAPELPPCGQNAKSSRTWVDIYAQDGKRLNGFCALGKASSLDGIWFALEADAVPPSWVYVELNDRATNTKYKSNLADTSL